MTTYELMIVAVNDKADQLLGRVEKFIKDANGESVKVERLGKKQLAYVIKKQTDATYFVVNFQAEGEAVKPIWDKLRLEQEDLLRYLLLRKEEKKGKKSKRGKVSSSFAPQSGASAVDKSLADRSDDKQEEEKKPTVTVVTKKVVRSERVEEKKVSKGTKAEKKVSKVSKVVKKKGTKGKK